MAARIKKARWRLGWTQADAAFRIGLTFRYFAEIERGHRNPSLATLLAIATALRVKVVDLVDVEPGPRIELDALTVNPPKTGRKPTRPEKHSRSATRK